MHSSFGSIKTLQPDGTRSNNSSTIVKKANGQTSPDVFLTVSRSFVAAADARYDEVRRIETLTQNARARLQAEKDEKKRASIGAETIAETKAIQDETVARLADDYEHGALLSFFFAEQLKGVETAGFDVANFFADMMASFDPAKETKRPDEYAEARKRAQAAREQRLAARRAEIASTTSDPGNQRTAELVKELSAVEEILRLKDYNAARESAEESVAELSAGAADLFCAGSNIQPCCRRRD
jgi:hypothetical protein